MTRYLSFFLAAACFCAALVWSLGSDFNNPYLLVCNLVAEKIYLPEAQVRPWHRLCLQRSHLVKPWSSRLAVMRDIENLLQTLKVSHLELFAPKEAARIWTGVSEESGIESEFVDGELVIFKVHPGSAAEKAGLRYGDILVSLNGEQPNPWQVRSTSGVFVYKRKGHTSSVNIKIAELNRADQVTLTDRGNKVWQIIVPSFRKDFFAEDPLREKWPQLQKASLLILDFRGNQGGSFVAGLRFVSDFVCGEKSIGQLTKDRPVIKTKKILPNDLDDLVQLKQLDQAEAVELRTFPQKTCLQAPIKILIDAKTASVAEMVAQALKENARAEIVGTPSSGQLLVGVWYPLDELGEGVQISIPEALFESSKGHRIEGQGVQLDRSLYYNLREMQSGKDSWVERVMEARRK